MHLMQQLFLLEGAIQTVNQSTIVIINFFFLARKEKCYLLISKISVYFLKKKFTCVWHSAIFLRTSTHSCRALALFARNFNVSPEAQLIVNVRESSSLGQTTAPARCSLFEQKYKGNESYVSSNSRTND